MLGYGKFPSNQIMSNVLGNPPNQNVEMVSHMDDNLNGRSKRKSRNLSEFFEYKKKPQKQNVQRDIKSMVWIFWLTTRC